MVASVGRGLDLRVKASLPDFCRSRHIGVGARDRWSELLAIAGYVITKGDT